jgi:hypothetical protein
MTYYTYNYLLPEKLGETISKAVETFAKKEANRTCDLWYHGLPVWIVRGHTGKRVNRVQIDAVVVAPKPIISFTPDAYEDVTEDEKGLKKVKRMTGFPNKVMEQRLNLFVDEAVEKPHMIDKCLEQAWGKAVALSLDYALSWEYVSPVKL